MSRRESGSARLPAYGVRLGRAGGAVQVGEHGADAAVAGVVRGQAELGAELAGFLTFILTSAGSPLAGPAAAITCGDRAAPRDPDVYWDDVQRSRARHPLFGPVKNNIWPCAFWPAQPRERLTRVGADHRAHAR
ncbi:hypothetical protein [Nonomuraea sp. NPDC052265]|uniref:hypothetical protein n=1 Tax=Nonomuraea sp. NPDC052265 TaxID=3364374 RepID=UPI0037C56D2F